jgi:hypothetical protein
VMGCLILFDGVLDDWDTVIVEGVVMRWCRWTWLGPKCCRIVCWGCRRFSRSVSCNLWAGCWWLTLFRAFENPFNLSKHFFSTDRRFWGLNAISNGI